MNEIRQAPLTLEGWYVLHQFMRISWPHFTDLDPAERERRVGELADFFERWRPEEEEPEGWSGLFSVYGGTSDLMALHFRPDLEGLGRAERDLQTLDLAEHLALSHDYVSVVELGLYSLTQELREAGRSEGFEPGSETWRQRAEEALAEEREKGFVQRRLRPVQPDGMPYVCFYPMDKRRRPGQNWYTLSLEERGSLMKDHGSIGRGYVDRISQVISGSTGLDDWEWAVTLFGRDPLDFKELVTVMRYDEASAEYAEFGPFYVGKRIAAGEIVEELTSD